MNISQNTLQNDMIQRLARYKNLLLKFRSMGLSRIFSNNLSDAAGISASLVRKDFSVINMSVGVKRGGYSIDALLQGLDKILGVHDVQRVILVGCGKIGTALMNYKGFANQKIEVVAGFDNNPARINPANKPVRILPVGELTDFIQKENIQVAVLAVPENAAADMLDQMAAAGVQGVLNFSPVELRSVSQMFIQNINIAFEIENLFHFVRFRQRQIQDDSQT